MSRLLGPGEAEARRARPTSASASRHPFVGGGRVHFPPFDGVFAGAAPAAGAAGEPTRSAAPSGGVPPPAVSSSSAPDPDLNLDIDFIAHVRGRDFPVPSEEDGDAMYDDRPALAALARRERARRGRGDLGVEVEGDEEEGAVFEGPSGLDSGPSVHNLNLGGAGGGGGGEEGEEFDDDYDALSDGALEEAEAGAQADLDRWWGAQGSGIGVGAAAHAPSSSSSHPLATPPRVIAAEEAALRASGRRPGFVGERVGRGGPVTASTPPATPPRPGAGAEHAVAAASPSAPLPSSSSSSAAADDGVLPDAGGLWLSSPIRSPFSSLPQFFGAAPSRGRDEGSPGTASQGSAARGQHASARAAAASSSADDAVDAGSPLESRETSEIGPASPLASVARNLSGLLDAEAADADEGTRGGGEEEHRLLHRASAGLRTPRTISRDAERLSRMRSHEAGAWDGEISALPNLSTLAGTPTAAANVVVSTTRPAGRGKGAAAEVDGDGDGDGVSSPLRLEHLGSESAAGNAMQRRARAADADGDGDAVPPLSSSRLAEKWGGRSLLVASSSSSSSSPAVDPVVSTIKSHAARADYRRLIATGELPQTPERWREGRKGMWGGGGGATSVLQPTVFSPGDPQQVLVSPLLMAHKARVEGELERAKAALEALAASRALRRSRAATAM
jgi:hypothetical protein